MKNWVSSLLSGLIHSKTGRARLRQASRLDGQRRRTVLRHEFLEDRRQLAAGEAQIVGNDLLVEGTADDDFIIVYPANGGQYYARINQEVYGPFVVPGNILVTADSGNDFVAVIDTALIANVDGAAGDDYIATSFGNDIISGGAGNDQINAGEGNNTVYGDITGQQALPAGGNDIISTLSGDDVVYGGGGSDHLNLGAGNDYAFGGEGNDLIGAEGGNDRIYGGAGNDVVSGDAGDDLLVGNEGNDQLHGRTARDMIIGGNGNDLVNGHEDVDLVVGRGVQNEGSTVAGDAADLALTGVFAFWIANPAAPLPGAFVLAATDNGGDTLFGYTGGDRFFADQLDTLGDYNLPSMGADVLEVFAGSAALPPNAVVAPGTAALVGNDVVIQGTALGDRIIVSPVNVGFFNVSVNGLPFGPFNAPAGGIIIINAGAGDDFVEVRETLFAVTVNGEDGNDYIATSGGDDIITGGFGDDQINASSGNNRVWGDTQVQLAVAGDGLDKISTLGGDDIVYGGGGNDEINLGAGNDHGYGSAGDDLIGGEAGNDEIYGGDGNDTISGDAGNDLLVGNAGNDILLGRTGLDVLVGGLGADQINGGEDNDVLIGRGITTEASILAGDPQDVSNHNLILAWFDQGNSTVFLPPILEAADDNAVDFLYGFTGDDDFFADIFDQRPDFRGAFLGNDELIAFPGGAAMPANGVVPPGAAAMVGNNIVAQGTGLGDNIVVAPAGPDTLKVTINGVVFGGFILPNLLNPAGIVIINGGGGDDSLQISNTTQAAQIDGGDGQDYIAGSLGNDVLIGGAGDDQINGSEGDNTVYGDQIAAETPQDGSDIISTLSGNDIVYGRGGNDQIGTSAGNDYLNGGAGHDVLQAGDGNDRLYGGTGNDILAGEAGDDLIAGNAGNDQITGSNGRDVLIGGVGADTINGGADNDALIARPLTNEGSVTFNDPNDQAMAALLAQWVATENIAPLLGPNDGVKDFLLGGTGADDFYRDVTDSVTDFQFNIDQNK